MKFSCSASFVDEFKGLDDTAGEAVLDAMQAIVRDPWSQKPGRRELPPMWKPGTFAERVGEHVITYCRDVDQEGDQSLRFLHLRPAKTPFGGNAM